MWMEKVYDVFDKDQIDSMLKFFILKLEIVVFLTSPETLCLTNSLR